MFLDNESQFDLDALEHKMTKKFLSNKNKFDFDHKNDWQRKKQEEKIQVSKSLWDVWNGYLKKNFKARN